MCKENYVCCLCGDEYDYCYQPINDNYICHICGSQIEKIVDYKKQLLNLYNIIFYSCEYNDNKRIAIIFEQKDIDNSLKTLMGIIESINNGDVFIGLDQKTIKNIISYFEEKEVL